MYPITYMLMHKTNRASFARAAAWVPMSLPTKLFRCL